VAKKLSSLPAGRQNSKGNFKNQFQKSKGRDNLTTMLYSSSVKKVYLF
jgi:hypothetical protein